MASLIPELTLSLASSGLSRLLMPYVLFLRC
jgi:hypothetical protein